MASLPADDYYAVLGVAVGVDGVELRRAWRRLAARWHPDRAGEVATAHFQRLSAAYTVLSDPVARAAYDRRRGAAGGASAGAPSRAPAGQPSAAGPVRASAPAVMLKRLSGPLTSLLARGAAHFNEPGFVTLVLNSREAAEGGMVMVSMHVDVRCVNCAGRACGRCGGAGVVDELFSAWLAVRPGAGDGDVLVPSAELPGMVERVRFRVRVAG